MSEQSGSRRGLLRYLRYAEPAVLHSTWAALVAVLAVVGVTVGTSLDARVGAAVAAIGAAVTLLQGAATRASVVSPRTADLRVRLAASGVPDPGAGSGPG